MKEEYLHSPIEDGLVHRTPCIGSYDKTYPAVDLTYESGTSTVQWDKEKMIFKSNEGWFYYCSLLTNGEKRSPVGSELHKLFSPEESSWEEDVDA
jgi:hypothetical protein